MVLFVEIMKLSDSKFHFLEVIFSNLEVSAWNALSGFATRLFYCFYKFDFFLLNLVGSSLLFLRFEKFRPFQRASPLGNLSVSVSRLSSGDNDVDTSERTTIRPFGRKSKMALRKRQKSGREIPRKIFHFLAKQENSKLCQKITARFNGNHLMKTHRIQCIY